jgi:hypothetical protein
MNRFALLVVVFIPFAMTQRMSSQSSVPASQAWGPSVDGLRIGISEISQTVTNDEPQFTVALQNTSNTDFVVNLGFMLANGKAMFPDAVCLTLTDPNGNTRDLYFFDGRYPAVAGRLDDFTVALRSGATYVFPISLEHNYWAPATREYGVKLVPGRYRISARFEGRTATHINLDTHGIALMNFWKGTLQSDTLEFEVSRR